MLIFWPIVVEPFQDQDLSKHHFYRSFEIFPKNIFQSIAFKIHLSFIFFSRWRPVSSLWSSSTSLERFRSKENDTKRLIRVRNIGSEWFFWSFVEWTIAGTSQCSGPGLAVCQIVLLLGTTLAQSPQEFFSSLTGHYDLHNFFKVEILKPLKGF